MGDLGNLWSFKNRGGTGRIDVTLIRCNKRPFDQTSGGIDGYRFILPGVGLSEAHEEGRHEWGVVSREWYKVLGKDSKDVSGRDGFNVSGKSASRGALTS